jgi:hypothetical protein
MRCRISTFSITVSRVIATVTENNYQKITTTIVKNQPGAPTLSVRSFRSGRTRHPEGPAPHALRLDRRDWSNATNVFWKAAAREGLLLARLGLKQMGRVSPLCSGTSDSTCSAMTKASSTSIPRYWTVLSILLPAGNRIDYVPRRTMSRCGRFEMICCALVFNVLDIAILLVGHLRPRGGRHGTNV